jgi:hypothetical protein
VVFLHRHLPRANQSRNQSRHRRRDICEPRSLSGSAARGVRRSVGESQRRRGFGQCSNRPGHESRAASRRLGAIGGERCAPAGKCRQSHGSKQERAARSFWGFGSCGEPHGLGSRSKPHGFGSRGEPHGFGSRGEPHGFGSCGQPHGLGSCGQPHAFGSCGKPQRGCQSFCPRESANRRPQHGGPDGSDQSLRARQPPGRRNCCQQSALPRAGAYQRPRLLRDFEPCATCERSVHAADDDPYRPICPHFPPLKGRGASLRLRRGFGPPSG